jgi:hypothetical protein
VFTEDPERVFRLGFNAGMAPSSRCINVKEEVIASKAVESSFGMQEQRVIQSNVREKHPKTRGLCFLRDWTKRQTYARFAS